MASNDVTTAVVVDCPTPFAPPVVVSPQLDPMTAINPPNTNPLIGAAHKSHTDKKSLAELRNTVFEIPYSPLATNIPPISPVSREISVKTGNIKQHAITRGMTK